MSSSRPGDNLALLLEAFTVDNSPHEDEKAVPSTNSVSSRPPSAENDGSSQSFPTEKTSPIKANPHKPSDHLLINLLDDTEHSTKSKPPSDQTTTSQRHPILNKSRESNATKIEQLVEQPPKIPEQLEIWLKEKHTVRTEQWNSVLGIEGEEISTASGDLDRKYGINTTRPRWNPRFVTTPTSREHMPLEPKHAQQKKTIPQKPPTLVGIKKEEGVKRKKLFGGYGPSPSYFTNFGQVNEQYVRKPLGGPPRKARRRPANQRASFIPQTYPRPFGPSRKPKTKRVVDWSEDEEEEAEEEAKRRDVKEVKEVEVVEEEVEQEEELLIDL